LVPDPRTTIVAIGVAVAAVAACGEIAGLRDPDALATIVDPDGGAITSEAGADDILIEPLAIDVGPVACGTASTEPKTVVIENRGTTTPKYAVQIAEGSGFELTGPLEGELGKGAKVTIGVVAKPAVAGELTGVIDVTAGTVVSQIAVKALGEGAHFEIAPSIANLGAVRRENGGSLDVALTNTGNKPGTITKVDSSQADFSATWEGSPAPLVVDPGATKTMTVKLGSGADSDVLKGMMTFGVDGAHCGAVPVLPVEGQRVNQDVTISPADFGNQNCTTTPTLQRDVVISNYTTSTLAYTASLRSGAASLFNIVSGATDNIPPGSSSAPTTRAVKLSMKQVPTKLGPVAEIVDVEVTGIGPPSGGPRTAQATASVRGIVLNLSQTNMTNFRYDESRTMTFTNAGNEPWSYDSFFIREPNTTQQGAWTAFYFGNVSAGGTRTVSIRFRPGYYGYYAGSWTFESASGMPFCNGTPKLRVQGAVYDD
jgi:hypothetical protein